MRGAIVMQFGVETAEDQVHSDLTISYEYNWLCLKAV